MSICITTIMAQIFLQVWGNTIQKKLKMISPCMTWHVLYAYYLRLETWFTAKQFPRDLNFRSLDKKNRDMANGKLYCRKNKAISFSLAWMLASPYALCMRLHSTIFVKLQVLGLRLGVDFTFTLDNNNNNHNNGNDNDNNPHLNFFKGTVLGVKEQGLGIRDKG